ncbi:MAG: malic enzyme-like NAD(P)-binding protein [Bacillota bacterium]|nr:malic enzyme-like NAD(P)-binding protein [Bacillota bacterium]
MSLREETLKIHRDNKGKISVISKVKLKTRNDLSLAYTPGVAEPCKDIHENREFVFKYTSKGNMVAVVSDGTAVLGLGNIGPEAALPVMEGKSILFKAFAGVDAFPICLGTTDINKIIEHVKLLEPSFGGINLEDIAAPACFEIERRLIESMDIPVFHDDQHGTAIVVLAGLINAAKIVGKKIEDLHIVVNGAGAAAVAVIKLLLSKGLQHVIMCDRQGSIYEGRPGKIDISKQEMAKVTNAKMLKGNLADVIVGADVFIGLSSGNVMTTEMVRSMAPDPIIFAMANPTPEIMPEDAFAGGAAVVATGRSDFDNQINNVLAFPGVFRGALDTRAKVINEEMKTAAAYAIAKIASENGLRKDYIIPDALDARVAPKVAAAVAQAAMETKVAKVMVNLEEIEKKTNLLASI